LVDPAEARRLGIERERLVSERRAHDAPMDTEVAGSVLDSLR
jgi:hypothetical protein